MNHFVVFLKDYEHHKNIVCILPEASEAIALCKTLNAKCEEAMHPLDFDEIMYFAEENSLNLTCSMIAEVSRCGSHFTYEAVKYKWSIDYAPFGTSWDDTAFDACSSDMMNYFDYNYDYDPEDDLDPETGIELWIDTKHVSYHKLKTLSQSNTVYRWFDPEFAHIDVALAAAWYDPIHRHCNWEGYRRAKNNVVRLIRKHSKGGVHISKICRKIRNNVKYRKCNTFRTCANNYLEAMENWIPSEGFGTFGNLDDYVVIDNILYSRKDAAKYVGYKYKEHRSKFNGKTLIEYEEI